MDMAVVLKVEDVLKTEDVLRCVEMEDFVELREPELREEERDAVLWNDVTERGRGGDWYCSQKFSELRDMSLSKVCSGVEVAKGLGIDSFFTCSKEVRAAISKTPSGPLVETLAEVSTY